MDCNFVDFLEKKGLDMHLVTGGSGFLGSLIVKKLVLAGQNVRVLDIWDSPDRPASVEFVNCDINDREGVANAMRGVDVVHHNVALVPLTKSGGKFWDVNVVGSQIAAEEAGKAGVRAFIHMSSSAIYGSPKCPIDSSTPLDPIEIYGKGKYQGELVAEQACAKYNIPFISIRPRTILGEGRLGIFQILFEWISEGRNVYTIGDGDIDFQFVHAHDLMDFYMLALAANKPGKYNVGAKDFGKLRDDLQWLIKTVGSESKVKSLPATLSITALQILDKIGLSPLAPWHYLTYHKEFHFDVKPLLEMGWKPNYSNQKMLLESYNWFIHNKDSYKFSETASAHRKYVKEGILKIVKFFS